jgi:hypothetical protein
MDTPPLIEQELSTLLKHYAKANKNTVVITDSNIRDIVSQIVNSLRVDSICFRIIQKVGSDWVTYVDFDRLLTNLQELNQSSTPQAS